MIFNKVRVESKQLLGYSTKFFILFLDANDIELFAIPIEFPTYTRINQERIQPVKTIFNSLSTLWADHISKYVISSEKHKEYFGNLVLTDGTKIPIRPSDAVILREFVEFPIEVNDGLIDAKLTMFVENESKEEESLEDLNKQLEEAVKNEDFVKAAEINAKIKTLQSNNTSEN